MSEPKVIDSPDERDPDAERLRDFDPVKTLTTFVEEFATWAMRKHMRRVTIEIAMDPNTFARFAEALALQRFGGHAPLGGPIVFKSPVLDLAIRILDR